MTAGVPETTLPARLEAWRDYHRGRTVVVCGCGVSLNDFKEPERFITIGVNDVGRLFQPTYLVVLNPPRQFSGDRFRFVQHSRAAALFTQLDLGVRHPHIVRFRLGQRGGSDPLADPTRLHFARNSPYVALQLAILMGASRIGIIGVDFTDHHFFAQSGRHNLTGSLAEIDSEYRRVAEVARRRNVEIVNLSAQSRLTAFPKVPVGSFAPEVKESPTPARIFFVHYQFLSCGDVFRTGLHRAVSALGLTAEGTGWDDAALPAKVARFNPDLLFVIHGRRFIQRWGRQFMQWPSAVWLLDEPYEVDDTERISSYFQTVFVNDLSTLDRHRNAHYLPVAFDETLHCPAAVPRNYDVGFIGGGNPSREAFLSAFARSGLLSYVVGGPWSSPALQRLCLSSNVPPSRTAALYQRSRIVLNVFRDKHHFNRRGTPGYSLNPRVYEALACGALVLSEERPEAREVFPEMPVFRSPAEAVDIARGLLAAPDKLRQALDSCRQRIEIHTYTARLQTALKLALNVTTPAMPSASAPVIESFPRFAILMAVHNGLPIVRASTLKTLQHMRDSSARLVVVDNASTDGTQEWLRFLAARGDIDLIRLESNVGHGPALEKARAATRSEFIVTLDSDAFPLTDDWLEALAGRIDGATLAAGIGHHRGYAHPSCLIVSRATMERLGSTFLVEKCRSSPLDVAERLTADIRAAGGDVSFLEPTLGSAAEPVFGGVEYGGIVFHQWHTTRHLIESRVDDVPREGIERALREMLDRLETEPRELTVVLGLRASPAQPKRMRNARFVLENLNLQKLERWRYRIVVVEQDEEARLEKTLGFLADRWIFARNPGPYNRSWAFNVGAVNPPPPGGVLFLTDADLLFDPDILAVGLRQVSATHTPLVPYKTVNYLTPNASESVLRHVAAKKLEGRKFDHSQGGCMFLPAQTFHAVGGFDERFEGWGAEDREFWMRISGHGNIDRLDRVVMHLDHERPNETGPEAEKNRILFKRIKGGDMAVASAPIGRLDKYGTGSEMTLRDWQNWETWPIAKIERIVEVELRTVSGTRPLLARLLGKLATTVLDVGCGPGAMNARLRADGAKVCWTGADITAGMLRVARNLFPDSRLVRTDAAALPFRPGAFDAVLLRHVLEHLPFEFMRASLREAMRVAGKVVVIDFYVRPGTEGRTTARVGAGFLETRWTVADIEEAAGDCAWNVLRRHRTGRDGELWILVNRDASQLASELDETLGGDPKISIVMPTYRRPHTLPRTLRSVVAQTYRNWELILIDNAGDAVLPFQDERIRLFRETAQASASFARNCGVGQATGDFVCFFDDDDLMLPTYLESFVSAFRHHRKAAIVRCGMLVTGNRVNYSYATPECCLRREFATATWDNSGPCQDQRYFKRIVQRHGWSEEEGHIVTIRKALCRALHDAKGGLRSGHY